MCARSLRFSTKASLIDDLRLLGLTAGDGVFVHSSMKAMGPVIGGARAVVEALLARVGPDGLLAGPGFSRDAFAPDPQEWDPPLSPEEQAAAAEGVLGHDEGRATVAEMGVIAETIRTWPGACRSPHPTSSICAIGPDAATLCARHPLDFGCGPDGPYGAMATRANMKILLIGVDWTRCSALHLAEARSPRRRLKTDRFFAPGPEGGWTDAQDVADDLGRLFPIVGAAFEHTDGVRFGRIGRASSRLFAFSALVEFAAAWFDGRLGADRAARTSDVA